MENRSPGRGRASVPVVGLGNWARLEAAAAGGHLSALEVGHPLLGQFDVGLRDRSGVFLQGMQEHDLTFITGAGSARS